MKRSTCYFSGTVQGVGFRYTAMNIAQGYDVVGFVRNLSDGRVELVIEGADDQRKGMIQEIAEQMGMYISGTQVNESPATGEYQRFQVRH
jgi:acylphosphatase